MKIGPLFKWFGSKWQSAKRYPPPQHDTIVEPFAGGAGYSLNYCDRQVKLAEADPNLLHLWSWLIHEARQQDVLDIPIDLPVGADISALGLCLGQQMLLKHWQRTNNVGDCWTVSPWGNKPGQWTASTRSRVAEEIQAIRHWSIGFGWPMLWGAATWFIDPPYQYNYRYRRDLPTFAHEDLAVGVRALPVSAQIIVCEAACKKTGRIPDYLPFVASHRSVTSRRKSTQAHHSNEVIYVRS